MRRLGGGGFSAYLRRSRRHAVAAKVVTALRLEIVVMIGEKSAEIIVAGSSTKEQDAHLKKITRH